MRRAIAGITAALAAITPAAVIALPPGQAPAARAAPVSETAYHPRAAPAVPQQSRRVRSGDTLSGIALAACGAAADWPALAAASGIPDGNDIAPGQLVVIACQGPAAPAARPAGAAGGGGDAGSGSATAPPAAAVPAPGTAGGWAAVAQCESGGNWSISYGNGPDVSGGLQIALATWAHFGGLAYAPAAYLATEAQQIAVADRILAAWGIGQWPQCGSRYGYAADTRASVSSSSSPAYRGTGLAGRALAWAETQAGVPYAWGGTGPGGYDCSGLVMEAYLHAGVTLPRDTYEMLADAGGLLEQVSDPQPGDLAFFGTGHVELWVRPGVTFGAQQPGTDVGFHGYGGGYAPTAFYEVR